MEKELSLIYKDYKLSRDSIQLADVFVAKCAAEIVESLESASGHVNFKLKHGYEWARDKAIRGYLVADVDVLSNEDEKVTVKFLIEVVGLFEIVTDESVNKDEYNRRLELQLIPQLLPYVRSTLATLSALLTIPPVVLPTMDILRSIKKNGQNE